VYVILAYTIVYRRISVLFRKVHNLMMMMMMMMMICWYRGNRSSEDESDASFEMCIQYTVIDTRPLQYTQLFIIWPISAWNMHTVSYLVPGHRVLIGNWIYWTLITRNYK
jgi:hypothetical protein